MATLRITQSVESQLADIIASASDPESAAVASLSYLRTASSQTTQQPAIEVAQNDGRTLYDSVRLLRKATPGKRNHVPILDNILLECDNGKCTMRTSNFDAHYVVSFRSTSDQSNLTALVDADALYKALRAVKKCAIVFSLDVKTETKIKTVDDKPVETSDLVITADGNEFMRVTQRFPLDTLEDEFPATPDGLVVHTETLDLDFARVLSDHADTNPDHPILANAVFSSAFVGAADGFRGVVDTQNRPDMDDKLFAYRDLLKDASMFLEDATIKWITSNELYAVITGTTKHDTSVTMIQHCDDGRYPDLLRILPRQFDYDVYVSPDTFLSALKIVAPMAKETAGIVRITLSGDTFRLDADSDQTSGGSELDIDTMTKGAYLETAANIAYLKDAAESFKRMGCDQLRIRFQEKPNTPFVFVAGDASSGVTAQIVVMPMHLGRR